MLEVATEIGMKIRTRNHSIRLQVGPHQGRQLDASGAL
jgi:hypothetical protein